MWMQSLNMFSTQPFHFQVSYWKREMKKLELQEVPGEEVAPLTDLTNEEILAINMEEITYELNLVEEKLAASKPNMAAIAEYKKKEEVCNFVKVSPIYLVFLPGLPGQSGRAGQNDISQGRAKKTSR